MWPDRYGLSSLLSYCTPCPCALMACYSQSVLSFKILQSTSKFYGRDDYKFPTSKQGIQ